MNKMINLDTLLNDNALCSHISFSFLINSLFESVYFCFFMRNILHFFLLKLHKTKRFIPKENFIYFNIH